MKTDLYVKAKKWAPIMGYLPGVAAVFLSGSLSQGNAKDSSDIDFFILAYPGQIWTARFWTSLILKLTFNLAKPNRHKARICPNHFITTDVLEINEQDAYSAHLFSHNQPLYDPHHFWPLFVEANSWVQAFKESFPAVIKNNDYQISTRAVNGRKKNKFLECFLRWIQLKKIYRNPDFKKPGARIVLKNEELRFHPDPKNQYWPQPQKNIDLGKQNRQAKVDIRVE